MDVTGPVGVMIISIVLVEVSTLTLVIIDDVVIVTDVVVTVGVGGRPTTQ